MFTTYLMYKVKKVRMNRACNMHEKQMHTREEIILQTQVKLREQYVT